MMVIEFPLLAALNLSGTSSIICDPTAIQAKPLVWVALMIA
jgi:hypothetical protein